MCKWREKYPCIQPVKGDPFSFLCTTCNKTVSCKHMGIGDVKRHIQAKNHEKAAKQMEQQSFFSTRDPVMKKVHYGVISV